MSEKLHELLADFVMAHARLEETLGGESNELMRDAALKRFEVAYELFWRILREFLRVEGLTPYTPRMCFKHAVDMGLLEDQDTYLHIVATRSMLSRPYDDDFADDVYYQLPKFSTALMAGLEGVASDVQGL